MIVQQSGDALLLITQPDHAALSAELMEAWRADGFPGRATREAVLFATRHHDIGWTEPDAAPTVDAATGRPFDFTTAPVAVKQPIWPRAVGTLSCRSTYAAALVAQHALTIYRRFREDPAWRDFFQILQSERDRWLRTDIRPDDTRGNRVDAPVADRHDFDGDYRVLRIGDLMSLTFCNAWQTTESVGPYTIILRGSTLHIAPDPFGREVPFSIQARRISDRAYRDDEDLRDALRRAPARLLEGVAVGCDRLPAS